MNCGSAGGRVSSGMAREIEEAQRLGIPHPTDWGAGNQAGGSCPLRWSKAKLRAEHGYGIMPTLGSLFGWNRRVPTRGGPQRHRAGVGQRDRSLPHRSDKKEVPSIPMSGDITKLNGAELPR